MKCYCLAILLLIFTINASIGQVIVQHYSVIHNDKVVGSTSVLKLAATRTLLPGYNS